MKKIFFILLLFPIFVSGQKSVDLLDTLTYPIDLQKAKTQFSIVAIVEKNTLDNVKQYLTTKLENLQNKDVTIQLLHQKKSLVGQHFTFQQYYHSIPIYRSQIKVNVDNNGNIISLFDNTFSIKNIIEESFPNESTLPDFYIRYSIAPEKMFSPPEKTYFFTGKELVPVIRIEAIGVNKQLEMIISNQGQLLYQRDMLMYASPKDSTVTAKVFLPDPLTTAKVVYGAPYVDANDSNISQLNAQRATVSMVVNYNNNQFTLENPFVKITEHSPPKKMPVTSTTPDFDFTRSQDGFEDVNAFYHINSFRNYIQNIGGFDLVNFLVHIDTHGHNGDEQSSYNPVSDPPEITFGEGGVDDAEDADVIIHEYTHAILDYIAPNTNNGTERKAIDEANGDYFAASYSRNLNSFHWERVFQWDGHNEFWSGRNVVSIKKYPQDKVGNIYKDAEIWSSTLMEIWGDIGKEATDLLLLQSAYSYASNMSMPEAAMLFLQTDSLLYNGTNHTAICKRFNNRGILKNCEINNDCSPIASFTYTIGSQSTIYFSNTSYNANTLHWFFGDGTISSLSNPKHIYHETNDYIITLIATNSCGSDTITDTIKIEEFTGVSLKNSLGFSYRNENAVLSFQYRINATVLLTDITGKIIFKEELIDEILFEFNGINLANGVYLLHIVSPDGVNTYKLVKFK